MVSGTTGAGVKNMWESVLQVVYDNSVPVVLKPASVGDESREILRGKGGVGGKRRARKKRSVRVVRSIHSEERTAVGSDNNNNNDNDDNNERGRGRSSRMRVRDNSQCTLRVHKSVLRSK